MSTRAAASRQGPIREPYATRLAGLRAEMAERELDAYLVTSRMDQIWLTGFTGEDGSVLVTPRSVILLTDGRFGQTADQEAPWARKVLRKKRDAGPTVREFRRYGLERVGFEPAHLTVAVYTALRKEGRPTQLVSASGLVAERRMIKDAGELAAIRRAIAIAERAFARLQSWVRPGRTEREVAARLVYEIERCGGQGPAFAPIVGSGPGAALPHYAPGDRALREGEAVLIDWGARADWYNSDLTRILRIGSIPRRLAKVYDVVRDAHDRAIDAVRPGASAAQVDHAARKVIAKAGYGPQFTHALGHGIGLDVHEGPRLGRNSEDELQAGMVVTIEPGVYLQGVGGIRIESDVLVTAGGREVLSSLPY